MAGIARAVTPIGTVQSSRSARLALLAFRATSVAPTAPDVSPATTTAPLAEPGDESPGEQSHRRGDDRHRQQGKARVQRVQPTQPTEADRQAEDAPVQAEVEDEADRDDRREGVVPEDVGVDERPAHRSLDERERRGAQDSGDPERERHARRPAVRAGADEPPGEGRQAEHREQSGRADRATGAGESSRPRVAARSQAAASPTGTFTRKIARQPTDATRIPPTRGPLARPIPDTAPQTASARPRAWGSREACG